MARYLTVGIIQMPISRKGEENFHYIEKSVDVLMCRNPRPELVVGVEGGIGYGVRETIPGEITNRFSDIARRNRIYLVPGTMFEINPDCPDGEYYNSAPIFGPDGKLIDVYRKMAPWRPAEYKTFPGKRYVVFTMPEKQIKIGVLTCYDLNFPEICRNLALSGAEMFLKLTEDFEEAYRINKPIHLARAIENQAFLISANAVGLADGYNMYGHSAAISPSGHVLLEGGSRKELLSVTIDVDEASAARKYGTCFCDHYLSQLAQFDFPMPYSGKIDCAPVYKNLKKAPLRPSDFREILSADKIGSEKSL